MVDKNQIEVFDRALLRNRRDRAALRFVEHDALFAESAAQIIERLADIKMDFKNILDLGAHTGALARHFARDVSRLVVTADLSEKMLRQAAGPRVAVDEEWLPFAPASFDLVTSNLSLHWVNDLPGALAQIKNILRPGGLFIASLIGGESLYELRQCMMEAEMMISGGISPRLSPVIDLPTASALLQRAGFILPVTDSEKVTLVYADAFALMNDLRGMGETNTHRERLRRPTKRQIFLETARLYAERFTGAGGGIEAGFELIFLHGCVDRLNSRLSPLFKVLI